MLPISATTRNFSRNHAITRENLIEPMISQLI